MKVLFVEARRKFELNLKEIDEISDKLPKKIGLIASIQYINIVPYIKKELEKRGKKVFISKGNLTKYPGQVLGCDVFSAINIKNKVEALLLLGSGKFHAIQIAIQTKKSVFIWQPGAKLNKLSTEDIKDFENKKKVSLIKFLQAEEVGILVSTKHGQFNLKKALLIKKQLEKKKKVFLFLFDTLNFSEFENFPVKSFVNTSCPNMILDDTRIINYGDIPKL